MLTMSGKDGPRLLADTIEIKGYLEFRLTNAILIEIVGIAPRPLLETISQAVSEGTGVPVAVKAPILYYTPSTQIVFNRLSRSALGSTVQRWNTALTALRNALGPRMGDDPRGPHHFAHGIQSLYLDCLVRCTNELGKQYIMGLSSLPGKLSHRTVILWEDPELNEVLNNSIGEAIAESSPLYVREVLCKWLPQYSNTLAADLSLAPGPEIKALASYGMPVTLTESLRPVSVVAIRGTTPSDEVIFLKRRTPQTDHDDWGVLSLLSARVLEEDLALAFNVGVPATTDATEALKELWLDVAKPTPFIVPRAAFVRAAQRELYMTCGLDVVADRLKFRGIQLIEREDSGPPLWFTVFELQLNRSTVNDEFRVIDAWNQQGMTAVSLERLYSSKPQALPLNRLLRVKREWLEKNVFQSM